MPEFKLNFNNLENTTQTISKYIDNKNLILLKHSSDIYSQSNAISLKILLEQNFRGVYISFQRPLKNLDLWLEKNKLDKRKMIALDYSNSDRHKVSELYRDILNSLSKLSGDKKFIFIDSINTMALCNSELWADDFKDRLLDNLKSQTFENTMIIVNVAEELCKKNIVKNFASYADGVIDFSNPTGEYSKDLIKNRVFN